MRCPPRRSPHPPPTQGGYAGSITLTKRQANQGYEMGPYKSKAPLLAKKGNPQYTNGWTGNQRRAKRQLRGPPHRNQPHVESPPQHKGRPPTPQRPPNTMGSPKITRNIQVRSTLKGTTGQPPDILCNSIRGAPPPYHTKGQTTPHDALVALKENFLSKSPTKAKGQGGQNLRNTPRKTRHPPPTPRGNTGTITLPKIWVGQGIISELYTSIVLHTGKKEIPPDSTGKGKNQKRRKGQQGGPPYQIIPPIRNPPQHKEGIQPPQHPPSRMEGKKLTRKLQICSNRKGATGQSPVLHRTQPKTQNG